MNKKGFTLVELLAVLVIIGLLSVILIPSYQYIFTTIKKSNVTSKVSSITSAAYKYGNRYKDEIKRYIDSNINTTELDLNKCMTTNVEELITKGYISSEVEDRNAIVNTIDNNDLDADIYMCYCTTNLDLSTYYVQEFSSTNKYYKGDYVYVEENGVKKLYLTNIDYDGKGNINSKVNSRNVFILIDMNKC